MSVTRKAFINYSESIVTLILLLEILLRFTVERKTFHHSKRNLTDLGLAIITSIMQIPLFRRAGRVYTWFTAFQIARSYRIFWEISPVRDLMVSEPLSIILQMLIDPVDGIISLLPSSVAALWLPLSSGLLGICAGNANIQSPSSKEVLTDEPFSDLWKSFLGMYQIFTGEDWTKLLYAVTQHDSGQKLGWIGAIFIIGWLIVSSIIILNMFLSRIDDSLNLPDDRKRFFQVKSFFRKRFEASMESSTSGYTQVSGGTVSTNPHTTTWTDTHVSTVVARFLGDDESWKRFLAPSAYASEIEVKHGLKIWSRLAVAKILTAWQIILRAKASQLPPFSVHCVAKYYGKFQQGCKILLGQDGPSSSWSRYTLRTSFKTFIYMSIILQIAITCVTTPLYQREYWFSHKFSVMTWYVMTDFGFALLWIIEAVVKIIAGRIIIGPDAYLRGWNLIDAIVLITSWVGLALTLYNVGRPVAALIASFKAFRVLRLLTLNEKVMRDVTFVFRRGSYKVVAAILVSLSLLTPFALFGLNLFEGQSLFYNDSDISNLNDCVGEFVPSKGAYLLAPRAVSRPYYSFDTFGQSFYTLSLIVSQEGWTDVMYWARGVSGDSSNPGSSNSTSNMNAFFFVIFNFCGTIFVTALFASVMIQNYTEATGVAYLTRSQRAWNEQKKLFQRVHPSRRPAEPENLRPWRRWCYNLATRKEGKWQKFIIATFVFHLLLLCVDFYPSMDRWELTQGKLRKSLFY